MKGMTYIINKLKHTALTCIDSYKKEYEDVNVNISPILK